MVLSARLFIDGHQTNKVGIPLLSCNYTFTQDIDQRGLTVSRVQGGVFEISMLSIDDAEIVQWMFTEDTEKDGKILFSGSEHAKSFKTIEFKKGRLVKYSESFSNKQEMILTLGISAKQVTISGATHENIW